MAFHASNLKKYNGEAVTMFASMFEGFRGVLKENALLMTFEGKLELNLAISP